MDVLAKFAPFTVSGNPALPAAVDVVEMPLTDGTGAEETMVYVALANVLLKSPGEPAIAWMVSEALTEIVPEFMKYLPYPHLGVLPSVV